MKKIYSLLITLGALTSINTQADSGSLFGPPITPGDLVRAHQSGCSGTSCLSQAATNANQRASNEARSSSYPSNSSSSSYPSNSSSNYPSNSSSTNDSSRPSYPSPSTRSPEPQPLFDRPLDPGDIVRGHATGQCSSGTSCADYARRQQDIRDSQQRYRDANPQPSRPLPLFEPELDPADIVRGHATGKCDSGTSCGDYAREQARIREEHQRIQDRQIRKPAGPLPLFEDPIDPSVIINSIHNTGCFRDFCPSEADLAWTATGKPMKVATYVKELSTENKSGLCATLKTDLQIVKYAFQQRWPNLKNAELVDGSSYPLENGNTLYILYSKYTKNSKVYDINEAYSINHNTCQINTVLFIPM